MTTLIIIKLNIIFSFIRPLQMLQDFAALSVDHLPFYSSLFRDLRLSALDIVWRLRIAVLNVLQGFLKHIHDTWISFANAG